MQIIVGLFFFAAMGVVATPIKSESNGLDARDEAVILITYWGVSKHNIPYPRYSLRNYS